MNLKPIHYVLGGVALTALIAAAKFVGGTPLDQTFTYQGQLRNAGQLVSGPVDLKISMWDADTGGSQVGSTNTFNAMQLNDGRFACGLNFGNAAFDGSNRWIQVEFRNPAGSGQYQALSPRDKITATPYALYALNGANGVWVYDTNQQSVSVMGKKVGIGTSNPTAALEVVDASGGDDSVKLPAGSIGASELASGAASASGFDMTFVSPFTSTQERVITVDRNCFALIVLSGLLPTLSGATVTLDGSPIGSNQVFYPNGFNLYLGNLVAPLSAGQHQLGISCSSNCGGGNLGPGVVRVSGIIFDRLLP
jgi:hypothetical protein